MTIHRLELLALLIGVRLTNCTLQEIHLSISEIRIFSDSQAVLHWVKSNSENGTFVDNRCNEIRTKLHRWVEDGIPCHLHYIPSEQNPADCATRGLNKDQMDKHVWWSGPKFLTLPNPKWPEIQEFFFFAAKPQAHEESTLPPLNITTVSSTQQLHSNSKLFPKAFSSLMKYRRVLSIVLKFLKVSIYNKITPNN